MAFMMPIVKRNWDLYKTNRFEGRSSDRRSKIGSDKYSSISTSNGSNFDRSPHRSVQSKMSSRSIATNSLGSSSQSFQVRSSSPSLAQNKSE